jgi:hypothetical protein
MNVESKISFLEHKLEHDRTAVVVSLVWMTGVLAVAIFGGFVLRAVLPSFDGKDVVAWVSPGVFSISLPTPIKEYLTSKQSILAVTWLRDAYRSLAMAPDDQTLAQLDSRFVNLFDKVATA